MKKQFGLGLALAAAPVAAQTQALPVQPISGTVLDVTAQGETRRTPDVATISAGVVTQAADAASAMRDNAARMDRVIAALKKAGVADRDVRTANISLSPQYRYANNEPPVITGYQASNTVTVRFRDIARSGTILDTLVATGANQINGPDLMLDQPATALDEARLDAMAKARARAELYAKAAGLRIKRILSISEASFDMPRPMPVMMRMDVAEAAPASKILPGEQALQVSVSVRFELE
ncbi:SIMPL domain-containing protein [Sphingomonas sp. ID1715]|uniref:SIMPL domain-containing protein n=1 Tax=Sphingomonas sp. ID1715 TaxID=1656898 RepID=UPI001488933F|nr:SIMPL domain-containing protein [Sphingomonas sp. ID1715]NNM78116.1 SIMPL domain-containing protein [Sphingomonas sp. ID1715]